MIVGLQGSGKTTTTGKLARWLSKNGHNPIMVSVDVYRPAARQQLSVIARDIKLPIYEGTPEETKPLELARSALREAGKPGAMFCWWTPPAAAHRRSIDAGAAAVERRAQSLRILVRGRRHDGQDAVKSADEFHKRLGITGVMLTKMDGDARGGAALSIRSITNQPLKFVGVGEKFDALEPFHPDRVAQRILGMGDMLSLIEKVEENIDQKQAEEMQRKLIDNEFTLEDFRDQLRQIRKLGPLESLLGMMPQLGPMKA
jgi:signal recognition particle subunit SRP54